MMLFKAKAERDMQDLSTLAYDYYSGSDWQVWWDCDGMYWYGLEGEKHGPYTFDQLNSIFEEYARNEEEE